MGQYANELYARNYSLECENRALRGTIEEFENGQRYKKIEEGYEKVIAGYRRETQRLKMALAAEKKTTANVRNIWFEQCDEDWEWYQSELEKKDSCWKVGIGIKLKHKNQAFQDIRKAVQDWRCVSA